MNKVLVNRSVLLPIFRQLSVAVTSEVSGKKLPFKKPFIKHLIAGSYDPDFLVYPELTGEKLKVLENKFLSFPKDSSDVKESFNKLISISGSDSNTYNENLVGNSICERTRLSEAISSPSLSVLTEIHQICVYNIISKYCTEEQKQRFLPGLLKGETSIAIAMNEESSGSDPSFLNTMALKDSKTSLWTINGIKPWVTNALKADFLLVFSKYKLHEKSLGTKDLSVFIIDRNTPGVKIESVPTSGLEECYIGKVTLDNVELREDNLIGNVNNNGYNIAIELLSSYKYSYAACFSSQLKNLLNDAIKFVGPRKQTSIDLKDCESIRKKISEVYLTIYTLDSMLYLISGLKDSFDIDISLESAIIHLFCVQNGIKAVDTCMELLGSKAYDKSLPYFKLRNDLKMSTNVLFTKDICKFFIALTGIQNAVEIMHEDVKKLRYSFNYPLFFFKKAFNSWRSSSDNPKLRLKLYMNLHQSLQGPSDQLEHCVLRFQYCLEKLLVNHGSEISQRQLSLERITDILVDIFAMTAILGRASRSYCTGILYSDNEVMTAHTFCQNASDRVNSSIDAILSDKYSLNDVFHSKIAGILFERGSYFVEHPLTQNIS